MIGNKKEFCWMWELKGNLLIFCGIALKVEVLTIFALMK